MPLPGYSIVVATRNRLEALRLSLPRMLAQDPPPAQLIVVDSSDDHAAVAALVAACAAGHPVRLTIIAAERGLTRQRNIGLREVDQPIVFFPDDDSIWFPNVAEAIMTVYERDTAGEIAAVCAYDSPTPPPDFPIATAGYAMSGGDRSKRLVAHLRMKMENALVPDPGRILGRDLIAQRRLPAWLTAAGLTPVEWMTGYRMSFRTEVIRRCRFDENLTRYSLFEDRDASYAAWRTGAVVATPPARVFHYRSPEKRDAGRRMGVEQLLNLAYLTAKHTPVGHPARRTLPRFARYKILLYRLAARDAFGIERLTGARSALKELPAMLSAPSEDSAHLYNAALRRCLHDE